MDFRGFQRGSWKSTFSLWARRGDFEDSMRALRGAQNRPMSTWWILEALKGAHENPLFHQLSEGCSYTTQVDPSADHIFKMWAKRRFWRFHETSERSSKSTYQHLMDFRGFQRGSWKSTFSLWARRGDFEDFMRPLRGAQNRPLSTWWILRILWNLWEELKIDLWALDGF